MNEAVRRKLWEDYSRLKTPEIREKIILEYAPLVKVVAGRLSMYLGYSVEYDDMVSYGVFGLIDAIDKFDMTKEVKFETYANLKIKGAIIDYMRKLDRVPRQIRKLSKQLDDTFAKLNSELGRAPTNDELAEAMLPEEDTAENEAE